MARDARLSILTAQEVDELYRLPRFTEADRGLYFDLSTAELKLSISLSRRPSSPPASTLSKATWILRAWNKPCSGLGQGAFLLSCSP